MFDISRFRHLLLNEIQVMGIQIVEGSFFISVGNQQQTDNTSKWKTGLIVQKSQRI